ncbi:MAG TPA: DegQ family serine endoprotease [Thermodesulfobacteriota bacterium]
MSPVPGRRLAVVLPLAATLAFTGAAGGAIGAAAVAARAWAAQAVTPQGAPVSVADLAERLEPTVVNVQVTKRQRGVVAFEPEAPGGFPFGPFAPGRPDGRPARGVGSGFVISPDGYILTNNHVVEGAEEVKVTFATGDEYQARVIGRDPKTDVALLKIEPKAPLQAAPLGDSDAIRVGDPVVAIGNPFGLEGTVTTGIISAKGRRIGAGPYDDFLQTDAAINPGNSGGPLFNLEGEVVGINTAIVARGQGVGFAIPINLAKALIPQLKAEGRVTRGWLGVTIQPVTPALAKSLKLEGTKGALVADVARGGPAARAGLEPGDVIVGLDGTPVEDASRLPHLVAAVKPGTTAKVEVVRDGARRTLDVTVGAMPGEETAEAGAGDQPEGGRVGLALAPVPAPLARRLDVEAGRGALVAGVAPGSPAEKAGLRPGDVILDVNRRPVSGPDEAAEAIRKAPATEPLLVRVAREGGATLFAAIEPRA